MSAIIKTFKESHAQCLMCGDRNPWSLGLEFEPAGRDAVRARFRANANLQGYAGILHGGMISALLDAAMTHCLAYYGVHAVTADLRIRFLRPVPWEEPLELKAWLAEARSPLYQVKAELWQGENRMAWAHGKFLPCPASRR